MSDPTSEDQIPAPAKRSPKARAAKYYLLTPKVREVKDRLARDLPLTNELEVEVARLTSELAKRTEYLDKALDERDQYILERRNAEAERDAARAEVERLREVLAGWRPEYPSFFLDSEGHPTVSWVEKRRQVLGLPEPPAGKEGS
ncbi:MAG: hypothetical protein KGJ23_08835 [Euryarchaeota archaeon]|nr:hypothetical protein [Euryarchaeota archaeon]MDE1836709.1 hypothetical protein [Euryarchaeota archaeon]MDE1880262.1 hypothetical protein [Euryarchaeota archaeon]MDE2044679.1 hypothetical protein [Thermoplasmata archaeon]